MKIWIDLSNAPHVRFFKTIIEYLQEQGEELIITTRKFGDTHRLLDLFGFEFVSLGKHGITLPQKLTENVERSYELSKLIIKEKPDVAVAKHSIELPRVAFGLGIPSVYMLDNEHALAANKLTLSLCDRIIMPHIIDVWDIIKLGADPNKIQRYQGTSEILHFKNFQYNDHIFQDMGLNLKKSKTILMRPEPSLASYLDADCRQSVLAPIVDILKDYANILILPRFKEQAEIFQDFENVTIIQPPVDTSSLMKNCDLMIGAGGTMNREAALSGTPVISCYPGDLLAVDKFYIDRGLMYRSLDVDDIVNTALRLLVQNKKDQKLVTEDLFELIIENIYEAAGERRP